MKFGKKVVLVVVRPVYRTFFEKPLWRFLARVKAFFFAEIGVQLGNFERRFQLEDAVGEQRWAALQERLDGADLKGASDLAGLLDRLQNAEIKSAVQWKDFQDRLQSAETKSAVQWRTVQGELQKMEANNAAQWAAIEQLILALFRQPEWRVPEPNGASKTTEGHGGLNSSEIDKTHAAVNLR